MLEIFLADANMFIDDRLFHSAYTQMPESRQQKIDRFRFDRDKRLSLCAGVLLRLSLHMFSIEEWPVISIAPQGKPFLRDLPQIHFNLSHSGNYSACAISDVGELGIDVEGIAQAEDTLIRKVCTPHECKDILSLPLSKKYERFFQLWTVKESYLKLLGTGLSLSPELLEVSFNPTVSLYSNGIRQPVCFEQWRFGDYWLTLCSTATDKPNLTILTQDELLGNYKC